MTEKDYLIGFKPEYSNLWFFRRPDPRYGTKKYDGRCSGQVIKNILWLYTDEGDIVLDPFAGGGTVQDVCDEWKRKCYSSDISPCRTDIARRDVMTDGLPDIQAKLIFLDPPYADMKKGRYTDLPTDLSNMTIPEFYDAMDKVGVDSLKHLQHDGRVVLMCGTKSKIFSKRSIMYDLPFELCKIYERIGFGTEERIALPQTQASSITGYAVVGARKRGALVRMWKDMMVFIHKDYDPEGETFDKKWLRGWDARELFE